MHSKDKPSSYFKAYFNQFEIDFTLFLMSRSEEIVPRSGMVLTVMGSMRSDDPCFPWELLGRALNDMVLEVYCFNFPFHIFLF